MEKDLLLCPITREGYIEGRYKAGEIYHVGESLRLPLEVPQRCHWRCSLKDSL